MSRHLQHYFSNIVPGDVLLDAGAGTGLYMPAIPSATKYIWLDLDPQKLQGFKARAPTTPGLMCDATMIALGDKTVDYALCVALSHHLDDAGLPLLFQELARVVRKKLVFLDAVKTNNLIGNVLWALDQGSFPRATEAIRSAIEGHFDVESTEMFHIYHHYFLCTGVPRP